ncbi:LytTR family DNA-binding domain-containing protein [Salinarimonas soli]|nr:LytTR family DNA-binding domain-containing protein [Salinarimonas soli]
MRERDGDFVSGGSMQLALREWRALYLSRRALALMAIAGGIVGLAGPFGTSEALPVAGRLAYWTAIVFLTFGVGAAAVLALPRLNPLARLPRAAGQILAALAAGPAIAAVVALVNLAAFPETPEALPNVLRLSLDCALIAAGVTAAIGLVARGAPAPSAPAPAGGPAIMRRLLIERRGRLLRLSVQDHYVEVHTERGMHLVLMRLADAIDETEGVPGLRVHRSHWVALEAIAGARREEGRVVLALRDGTIIPVSRGNVQALREVGVLR